MNKPIILVSLTLILMTLTACSSPALAAELPASSLQPATIQDPVLLEAWTILDNQAEPVQLWDGRILSGHDLAQFALDNAIPVVWGSQEICNGNSCSLKYCRGEVCSFEDGQPGIDPIYISPGNPIEEEASMDDLVDTLAHEIYHRTQPHGSVNDTLYEEYTAYYLGERLAGTSHKIFEGFNPLRPACLAKWFDENYLLERYQHFKAYPQALIASVDTSSETCSPDEDPGSQAVLESVLTCTLSLDGSLS